MCNITIYKKCLNYTNDFLFLLKNGQLDLFSSPKKNVKNSQNKILQKSTISNLGVWKIHYRYEINLVSYYLM